MVRFTALFCLFLFYSFHLSSLALADPMPTGADQYTLSTSSITANSALLSWSGAEAASFDVRWRKQGESLWVTTSEIKANNFLLTDLDAGQPYEWQLLPAGTTAWLGEPASFTTIYSCNSPYIYSPYLVQPTAIRVEWQSNNTASRTYIDLKVSGSASWTTTTVSSATATYTFSQLLPNTAYDWRVRYNCSPYSTPSSFTTSTCAPTNLVGIAAGMQAQLSWKAGPFATYTLLWRQQGGNWNTVSNTYGNYSLYNLSPNAGYDWQLQWECNGVPDSSPIQSFTTNCLPPSSVLVRSVSANQIGFSWRSLYKNSYAESYQVRYRPQQPINSPWSPSSYVYKTTAWDPNYDYTATLSGLAPNTAYEIQLQTSCPATMTSVFAEPSLVATTSSCTSAAYNLNTTTGTFTTASLNWSGDPAYFYAAQYRVAGATSWSQVGPTTSAGNTSVYLTGLQPGTVYEWRVLTYCSSSVVAPTPTAVQSFTTSACMTNGISQLTTVRVDYTSAALYWSDRYPSAGRFQVRYRPVGSSTYTVIPVVQDRPLNVTGLAGNTAYEWQVAALCEASPTSYSYSEPATFTTLCAPAAEGLSVLNQITSVNVSWYQVNQQYGVPRTYQVRYRPTGGDWATRTISTTDYRPTLSLTALALNKTYEWGVAQVCEAGVTSTSLTGTSFTTSCQNRLYDIGTRWVTAVKATLRYSYESYNSPGFQIRYRQVGAGNWTILDNVSPTEYTLGALVPYTNYEWQVAAYCPSGFLSEFSPVQTFTTNCYEPTSLYTYIDENRASLSWNYNPNVSSYTLRYRREGESTWITVDVSSSRSTYDLAGVVGAYEWTIQADCVNGLMSAPSPIQSFTTTCGIPTDLAVGNLSAYGATASWRSTNYTIQPQYAVLWRQAGAPAWTTVVTPQTELALAGLQAGATYQLSVQAQCGNVRSPMSQIVTFSAACSAPSALSSASLYYFSEPGRNLYWRGVPGTSYTVRWRRLSESGQPSDEWQVRTGILSSNHYLTQLLPGTYEWQVQSRCVDGAQSAFVGGLPFVIPSCPTDLITRYESQVESTSVRLSYTRGAVTELRWRPVGSGGWNVVSAVSYAEVTLTGLTENVTYEWQVRVLCPNQLSEFGPVQRFTTTCGRPASLTTLCVTPAYAEVSWKGPLSSTYEVAWRQTGAPVWSTKQVSGTTATLTNLSSSTYYEWRVQPACSPQSSTEVSTGNLFYTQCSAPTALTLLQDASCNSTLSWQNACYGSVTYIVRWRYNSGAWSEYKLASSTAFYLGALNGGTYVEAEVRTVCSGINSYAVYYSTTTSTCPPPTISNMLQSVNGTKAQLSWQTNCGPSELRWRLVGGAWVTADVGYNTAYQLTDLTLGATYEWQVRSTCPAATGFGSTAYFRTECNAPITEIYGIETVADSIRFYFGSTLPDHEVRYRPVGSTTWAVKAAPSAPVYLIGLAANTQYEMQLRKLCAPGVWSDWSPSRYASTKCPGATNLIADQLTDRSARLSWYYGVYSTSYVRTLRYRPLGELGWITADLSGLPPQSPYSYTLTALKPQTTYEWQLMYDCGAGGMSSLSDRPITFRTTGVAGTCSQMVTVLPGNWDDPSTWSCGRVPLATDAVTIRHVVQMPAGTTGTVLRISFGAGGQLRYGAGAKLLPRQ